MEARDIIGVVWESSKRTLIAAGVDTILVVYVLTACKISMAVDTAGSRDDHAAVFGKVSKHIHVSSQVCSSSYNFYPQICPD